MTSYKEYYTRTIAEHDTGLKLVIGGTGLAKQVGLNRLFVNYR